MIGDLELEFLRQPLFRAAEQFYFIVDEIDVVNDASAARTDQMMVVPCALWTLCQFIPRPAVTEIEFKNEPQVNQQFQGPVYGRESYVRMYLMHGEINILGTDMFGRIAQYFQDRFPGCGYSVTAPLYHFKPP
jgi:hypothetical protein